MPFLYWVSGEEDSSLMSQPQYGSYGLASHHPGTCPLILSVPHGGEMRPPFIQDRKKPPPVLREKGTDPDEDTQNRVSVCADIYTQEMGLVVAREYCKLTGDRPHVVMCNLHRSKLDANRPLHTAAEVLLLPHPPVRAQDPLAQQVYTEYHGFLEQARQEVGRGLVIDLHGQNHQQNSIGQFHGANLT